MRPTSEIMTIINKAVERGFDVNRHNTIEANLNHAMDYLVEDAMEFETFKVTECDVVDEWIVFNGQTYWISGNTWEVDGQGNVHKLVPKSKFSEEAKTQLMGKKIVDIDHDCLVLENGIRLYLSDKEIESLN